MYTDNLPESSPHYKQISYDYFYEGIPGVMNELYSSLYVMAFQTQKNLNLINLRNSKNQLLGIAVVTSPKYANILCPDGSVQNMRLEKFKIQKDKIYSMSSIDDFLH